MIEAASVAAVMRRSRVTEILTGCGAGGLCVLVRPSVGMDPGAGGPQSTLCRSFWRPILIPVYVRNAVSGRLCSVGTTAQETYEPGES
jgi:hypothetical protein